MICFRLCDAVKSFRPCELVPLELGQLVILFSASPMGAFPFFTSFSVPRLSVDMYGRLTFLGKTGRRCVHSFVPVESRACSPVSFQLFVHIKGLAPQIITALGAIISGVLASFPSTSKSNTLCEKFPFERITYCTCEETHLPALLRPLFCLSDSSFVKKSSKLFFCLSVCLWVLYFGSNPETAAGCRWLLNSDTFFYKNF